LKKKGQSGMDFNWNSLYMNVSLVIHACECFFELGFCLY
jgi:hypothetical protein